MTVALFYTVCLAAGVAYALLSGILSWVFGHGGGDVHVDASGHLDAGHLSPISGPVIATFITGFGAGGTIAHGIFQWSLFPGMVTATVSGLGLAAAVFAVLEYVFSHTQAGSEYHAADILGADAEVITPIREQGIGEIAYVVKGQRERMSARTGDGSAIQKGTLVVIESLAGATAFVRRKV